MGEPIVRLLGMVSPTAHRLLEEHVERFDTILETVYLGDLAEYAFTSGDDSILEAVNLLLQISEPGQRNLLMTGFVEGVPSSTQREQVMGLPEPMRSLVAQDLGYAHS